MVPSEPITCHSRHPAATGQPAIACDDELFHYVQQPVLVGLEPGSVVPAVHLDPFPHTVGRDPVQVGQQLHSLFGKPAPPPAVLRLPPPENQPVVVQPDQPPLGPAAGLPLAQDGSGHGGDDAGPLGHRHQQQGRISRNPRVVHGSRDPFQDTARPRGLTPVLQACREPPETVGGFLGRRCLPYGASGPPDQAVTRVLVPQGASRMAGRTLPRSAPGSRASSDHWLFRRLFYHLGGVRSRR